MKARFIGRLVPKLIYLIYRFLCKTIRWEYVGDRYEIAMPPFVLGYWHARILMLPYAFPGWNGSLLISKHQDGSYIADAAKLMGFDSTRGSSTSGGSRALLALIRIARSGFPIAVTPDGPKGPAEVMKMGVVQMAKKSGLPFRSACYATRRYWRAGSWDRFYIPKPFTRGVFVLSDPIVVEDTDEKTLARFQVVMDETQAKADGYFV
jgi:lysophospholipid acyltransferase (LPLAT)-like uncharacterized protein